METLIYLALLIACISWIAYEMYTAPLVDENGKIIHKKNKHELRQKNDDC